MWTRVIDLENTEEIDVESYEIDEDLLEIDEKPSDQPRKGEKPWKPLFYSKDFWKTNPSKKLDDYIISPDELFKLVNISIQHREMFLDRAEAVEEQNIEKMVDAEHDAGVQGRKVRSRGTNAIKKENEIKPSEYRNPVTIGRRRRVRKRANLTIDEKVAIVHSIIVDLNTMSDVAKEYRVTVACVSNLVRAAKKVPSFLREL